MADSEPEETPEEHPSVELAELLATRPPGTVYLVKDHVQVVNRGSLQVVTVTWPSIRVYCDSAECENVNIHDCVESGVDAAHFRKSYAESHLLNFRCRHCQLVTKVFAVHVARSASMGTIHCVKFGEIPAFGPQTPPKLKAMVEEDRANFMKGRRCESQDLGIGAFAYYRRVVEHQKSRFIGEIIKVAKTVNAPAEMIANLERAKAETQFSKAIDGIKPGVPDALLINGENPLTILHHALSEGLHAETDEECLEVAQTIRIVMADLSERMASILTDKKDLKNAVDKLMARRAQKAAAAQAPKVKPSSGGKEP